MAMAVAYLEHLVNPISPIGEDGLRRLWRLEGDDTVRAINSCVDVVLACFVATMVLRREKEPTREERKEGERERKRRRGR